MFIATVRWLLKVTYIALRSTRAPALRLSRIVERTLFASEHSRNVRNSLGTYLRLKKTALGTPSLISFRKTLCNHGERKMPWKALLINGNDEDKAVLLIEILGGVKILSPADIIYHLIIDFVG